MNNAATISAALVNNGVAYEEKFQSTTGHGNGSLVLKMLRRDGSRFCLTGYVSPGIENEPIQFASGSLESCRAAYAAAKLRMMKWYN